MATITRSAAHAARDEILTRLRAAASGDGGEESVNPLHDGDAVGVDTEAAKVAAVAKKKPKEAQAPAGGYMLVAKNLAKKKIKVTVVRETRASEYAR